MNIKSNKIGRVEYIRVVVDDELSQYISYNLMKKINEGVYDEALNSHPTIFIRNNTYGFSNSEYLKAYLEERQLSFSPDTFIKHHYKLCQEICKDEAIQIYLSLDMLDKYFKNWDVDLWLDGDSNFPEPTVMFDSVDIPGFIEACKKKELIFN